MVSKSTGVNSAFASESQAPATIRRPRTENLAQNCNNAGMLGYLVKIAVLSSNIACIDNDGKFIYNILEKAAWKNLYCDEVNEVGMMPENRYLFQ